MYPLNRGQGNIGSLHRSATWTSSYVTHTAMPAHHPGANVGDSIQNGRLTLLVSLHGQMAGFQNLQNYFMEVKTKLVPDSSAGLLPGWLAGCDLLCVRTWRRIWACWPVQSGSRSSKKVQPALHNASRRLALFLKGGDCL